MPPLTPQSVKAVLWSYDLNTIEVQKDKKLIIFQVLNFGSEDAIKWLFKEYGLSVIEEEARTIPLSQWNKKSLSLWKIIFSLNPKERMK